MENATTEVVPGVVPGFSGKAGDFQADLARLAAARNPPPLMPEIVPEPIPIVAGEPLVIPEIEPAQPPAAAIPIPEKFLNKDGTPNSERIIKSTADAELAYQKYLEKEKALRHKQVEVQGLATGQPAPEQANGIPPNPFAQRVEQDIQKYGLGAVLVELHAAAERSAYARATADIADIRQETENGKRQRELEALAQHDDWILSPEGIETLGKIREAKPWLNQAPRPWEEAYKSYIADKQMSERLSGKVQTPTPKAPTVSAPATPVSAAPRVQNPINTATMTKGQINAYVASLTPADRIKFFASRGLTLK